MRAGIASGPRTEPGTRVHPEVVDVQVRAPLHQVGQGHQEADGRDDACHRRRTEEVPGDEGIALLQHKLDVLRAHCEAEGRSYEAIEKTVLGPAALRESHPMAMPPEALPEFLVQLEGMGIDHYISAVVDRDSLNVLLDDVLGRSVPMRA